MNNLVKTEFPTWEPPKDWTIPDGFIDISWHNDTCPSFANLELSCVLWIDFENKDDREIDFGHFMLWTDCIDSEGCYLDLEKLEDNHFLTDNPNEVLDRIKSLVKTRSNTDE